MRTHRLRQMVAGQRRRRAADDPRPARWANVSARTTYTGTTDPQTFVTLGPFKFKANSVNVVFYGAALDGGTTGTDVFIQLHDGASALDRSILRTATAQSSGGIFHSGGFAIISAGDAPSDVILTLQYGLGNNGTQVVGIRDGWIVTFPLGPRDEYGEADAESTISDTGWAAGTDKLTKTFTPATSGEYLILAKAAVQGQTAGADCEVRLWDGTTAYNTVDNWGQRVALNAYGNWLGGFKGTLDASPQTWKVQTSANANSIKAKHARLVALRVEDLADLQWAESRGTSTTTATAEQVKASFTHAAKAKPYLQIAAATMKHSATTLFKVQQTLAGVFQGAVGVQSGSATATNYYSIQIMSLVTPDDGSRTVGIGYCASTTDTTTIEEAWVCAIRLKP